jgi:hypothetical protein
VDAQAGALKMDLRTKCIVSAIQNDNGLCLHIC